jgi:hypothetical protein
MHQTLAKFINPSFLPNEPNPCQNPQFPNHYQTLSMFSMIATTSAEKFAVQSRGTQQEQVSGFFLLETNGQKIEGERVLLD